MITSSTSIVASPSFKELDIKPVLQCLQSIIKWASTLKQEGKLHEVSAKFEIRSLLNNMSKTFNMAK